MNPIKLHLNSQKIKLLWFWSTIVYSTFRAKEIYGFQLLQTEKVIANDLRLYIHRHRSHTIFFLTFYPINFISKMVKYIYFWIKSKAVNVQPYDSWPWSARWSALIEYSSCNVHCKFHFIFTFFILWSKQWCTWIRHSLIAV